MVGEAAGAVCGVVSYSRGRKRPRRADWGRWWQVRSIEVMIEPTMPWWSSARGLPERGIWLTRWT
jgi:hypothetical protein